MTRRNRWLKKQARKAQGIRGYVPKRIRALRKAYGLAMAKYISEQRPFIPFQSLVNDLRNYANGKQDVEAYRKVFKIEQ